MAIHIGSWVRRYFIRTVRHGTYVYKHGWVSHVCSLIGGCEEGFHFPVLPVCPRIEVCNRHGVSKRSTEPTRCFNFLFGTSHSTCSTYTVYQFFRSTNPTQKCSVQTCSCFQRMCSPYFFSPPALPMTIDGLPRICIKGVSGATDNTIATFGVSRDPFRGHLGGFVLFETSPGYLLHFSPGTT